MKRALFDEDQELFRKSVRAFMEREVKPNQERWAEAGMVDRAAWKAAGKEEKAPYDAAFTADKARYEKECAEAGIEPAKRGRKSSLIKK